MHLLLLYCHRRFSDSAINRESIPKHHLNQLSARTVRLAIILLEPGPE